MDLHPETYGSANGLNNTNGSNGVKHTESTRDSVEDGTCLPAAKVQELAKLNSLENASSQSLFKILHKILDDSIENKKEDVPDRVASVLKKLIQMTEQKISKQAEYFKKQKCIYKTREEKYQLKFKVLGSIVTGTAEENELIMNQLHHIKAEKNKMDEIKKLEDVELVRLRKEKHDCLLEISKLKQEIGITKDTYEKRCVQLETQAIEVETELNKKIMDLESLLTGSRKKVKELEKFTESKSLRWKKKERGYKNFMDFQSGSLKELRLGSESIKQEVLKTQQIYTEEINQFGMKIQGLVDAVQNYHTVLTENRKLYNEVQDLKGNIRVYCRIRPFLKGQSQKQTTIEYIGENGELIVTNPSKQIKESHRLFKFNKVFSPSATQEDVFVDTQPLIRSVLDGYNVCIFAYGQTGSGKTYTMTGPNVSSPQDWGVNYRALNDLFHLSQTRRSSFEYEIGVQMVEIYNEQVRDLLSSATTQRRFGIWNSTQPNGLAVPDASMHPVTSTANVLELMNLGLTNRAVGATALNERSSRSHSVLTVHVRGVDLETNAVLRGNLHLVDLAGSERVDRSEATGDRLREAQHINKSLSALGDVIFALAQKSQHVPYRNSKLTQVLQSSLGGQAKTLMFVQLNPDVESFSETTSTLKFAERVSGVELGAARSTKDGRGVRELMEQVSHLKDALSKKDEEMTRLRVGKTSLSGEFGGLLTNGTPTRGDCLSETSSQKSSDEVRHHKDDLNDDIEILGLGEADSEDRLSDISDGGLSMGTETDGSLSSIVELTLFPGTVKAPVDHYEKPNVPAKLPRPPQKAATSSRKQVQTGSSSSQRPTAPPSRTSLTKGVPRVSLSSSGKKSTPVSSSVKSGVRR